MKEIVGKDFQELKNEVEDLKKAIHIIQENPNVIIADKILQDVWDNEDDDTWERD